MSFSDCFEKVGPEGQKLLCRLWRLDSVFALFLALVLAVVSHNLAAFRWLRWAMYGLAALRSLLDLLENALLWKVCAAYPARPPAPGAAKARPAAPPLSGRRQLFGWPECLEPCWFGRMF